MGQYLTPEDFTAFTIDAALLPVLIEDAEVYATLAAPPLANPASLTDAQRAQVKTVLRRAVVREADSGTGAKIQETAGQYSYTVDSRTARSTSFLTEEEEALLQGIVGTTRGNTVFSLDVTPTLSTSEHLPWCDLMFGGTVCTCGVAIAGYPLYEQWA